MNSNIIKLLNIFIFSVVSQSAFAKYKSTYYYRDELSSKYEIQLRLNKEQIPEAVLKFKQTTSSSQELDWTARSTVLKESADFRALNLPQDPRFPVALYIQNCPNANNQKNFCIINIGQDMLLIYGLGELKYLYLSETNN